MDRYENQSERRAFFAQAANWDRSRGVHTEFTWLPRLLKSGKRGKSFLMTTESVWSVVESCWLCGRIGGLRHVHDRSDVYGWCFDEWDEKYSTHYLLCNRCWPVAQRYKARSRQIDDISNLISKLRRKRKTMPQIQDTCSFRAFLCDCIEKTADGSMDSVTALRVAKIASQINESLRVELSAARLELERSHHAPKIGSLPLRGVKALTSD